MKNKANVLLIDYSYRSQASGKLGWQLETDSYRTLNMYLMLILVASFLVDRPVDRSFPIGIPSS